MMNEGHILNADGRQYTVIKTLGRGANTIAYMAKCRHGEIENTCILKEYSPIIGDVTDIGIQKFISSGVTENDIRNKSSLNNMTPPVSHIFKANGTAYIDVACYSGDTLNNLDDLSLAEYMTICKTIVKTVGYYHKAGFICLDIKPENIFILQNTPDDTITQMVEFIDFDSLYNVNNDKDKQSIHYTKEWASPEQINPTTYNKIWRTSDIYTLGELVFFLLFGRHSEESEHLVFSQYPFEECKPRYKKYIDRPDIQGLFIKIFRGTIRPASSNRFKSTNELTELLDQLIDLLEQKEYIVPRFPPLPSVVLGRDKELIEISKRLKLGNVLYITGIGGIGKSTLIKSYISKYKTDYDVMIYLEYDGDIKHTFCNDHQLLISTVSKSRNETTDEYFSRKLSCLRRICSDKCVLFVVDNFTGMVNEDLSQIIDCGYKTIIITRKKPAKNSFPAMELLSISDMHELLKLVAYNLERPITSKERPCFEEIISLVQGHTLVVELIARQIASGRLSVNDALKLINQKGFSRFSTEKIGNYKDGKEVYDTLGTIITDLFNSANLSRKEKLALKVLSLFDVRGLETELFEIFFSEISKASLRSLNNSGWIYCDRNYHVHPVIAQTVKGWCWLIDDVSVMDYHKRVIDIYNGMANVSQIRKICYEAKAFKSKHPKHIIKAMYNDILDCYYDVLLGGAYIPSNKKEDMLIDKMTKAAENAIKEIKLSCDKRRNKYIIKYYLSLASILIRSYRDAFDEAKENIDDAFRLIKKYKLNESKSYAATILF